jgi:hypothetical protein
MDIRYSIDTMANNQPLMAEHGYWAVTESDIAHAAIVAPLVNSNEEELTDYPLLVK